MIDAKVADALRALDAALKEQAAARLRHRAIADAFNESHGAQARADSAVSRAQAELNDALSGKRWKA